MLLIIVQNTHLPEINSYFIFFFFFFFFCHWLQDNRLPILWYKALERNSHTKYPCVCIVSEFHAIPFTANYKPFMRHVRFTFASSAGQIRLTRMYATRQFRIHSVRCDVGHGRLNSATKVDSRSIRRRSAHTLPNRTVLIAFGEPWLLSQFFRRCNGKSLKQTGLASYKVRLR